MTVVIIINKQRSEPLDNHDSSDYYKQTMVSNTKQPWQ